MKYLCPNCKQNKVERVKPRGAIPHCSECRERRRQRLLDNQREKRRAGLWDSHLNKDGIRYDAVPRTCSYCHESFINKRKGATFFVCDKCIPQYKKDSYEKKQQKKKADWIARPEHFKRVVLKRRLRLAGLPDDWYDRQEKRCAICARTQNTQKARRWHIDHDHRCCTNGCARCIRGLLCHKCNLAIGHFNDDTELMRKAADWIEQHRRIMKLLPHFEIK